MNPKITLFLVVLFVVVAGYLYFFEFQDAGEEKESTSTVQLFDREYDEYDIVELELVSPLGSANFVRTSESLTQDWEMLQPLSLPPGQVDQVRVNGAATRLGRLTVSQVISGVTNFAQYGLDPPELTATLTISDGLKNTLHTGAPTPVSDNRYIRIATDDQTVYLVSGFAIDDLHRLLDEPPLAPTPLPAATVP